MRSITQVLVHKMIVLNREKREQKFIRVKCILDRLPSGVSTAGITNGWTHFATIKLDYYRSIVDVVTMFYVNINTSSLSN